MKISSINFIQNNRNVANSQMYKTKPMQADTFEKTNVSFGAKSPMDDLLDSLIDSIFDDVFTGKIGELGEAISAYSDIIAYEEFEDELGELFTACLDKKTRACLKTFKNQKISDFFTSTINFPEELQSTAIVLFNNAGIKNVANLEYFMQVYARNPEPYNGQSFEAVDIYGLLKNKDDLSRYGEILLYLYHQENAEQVADFDKMNRTCDFLRRVGLNNMSDFDSKFSHLKSKFNGFEDASDKADAIEYLQLTYAPKTQLLDEILKQNPIMKSKNVEQVYSSINDIVDYFYDENNAASLDGLSDVIDYAVFSSKFKSMGLKQVATYFNEFQSPEDKVDFYRFLKDCELSISDFNNLSGKSVVSGIEGLDIYGNKQELTDYITQLKNINKQQGFEYYKKFSDVINGAYDAKTGDTASVEALISVIDEFKLKNSDSFLDFYRAAYGVKKQTITPSELKEFVELLKYNNSPNILNEARMQKTTAVELLNKEKEQFLSVSKDIEDFIASDDKAYFAGQTPLDLYKKYRKALLEDKSNIALTLQNIVNFDIVGQDDYQAKALNINKFTSFFGDREALMNFFVQNNIKFDNSEEDNEHINNCYTIFSTLYDENEKEKSVERIKYFAETGFIAKSEKRLTELLSKMPTEETRKSVLSLIADKQIPSITQMEKFFKQYQTKNSSGKTLISFLENLPPNVDFTSGLETLSEIQREINKLCIPARLNGDNIVSIDVSRFIGKEEIPTEDITSLLANVYSVPEDRNFLSIMDSSSYSTNEKIDVFRIATEIAKSIDKSSESYKNISRLLGIDKATLGLERDCSTYIYARAIQNELPKEFIELVQSNDWTQYSTGGNNTPSLSLHARLRAIDRFALDDVYEVKDINSLKVKQKLTKLLETVYTTQPIEIRGSEEDKRIIADFVHNGKEVEAVFGQNGKMVTIVPRRNRKVA